MKSIRILIVDDLPHVRQELASLLQLAARKFQPDIEIAGEAQNGNEAIGQAQTLRPDVILMDLEMPGIDGYEAASQIKALQPSCQIIALTIHSDEEARQRALAAGMMDLVVKGAPLEVLLRTIKDAAFNQDSDETKKGVNA
jgi:DNA-binding NarL/FixJ family response regulator